MKTSVNISNAIKTSFENTVRTRLLAEWNLNRYYRALVDNTPTEQTAGFNIEMFPIESVVEPNRPRSGIVKAIVNQAFAAPSERISHPDTRYYVCSVDDIYKYWKSPYLSSTTAPYTFEAPSGVSTVSPSVSYIQEEYSGENPVPRTVVANKIGFTAEESYAYPVEFDIQVKYTTGGAWTTVANETNVFDAGGGRYEIWWNGTSWTNTPTYSHTTTLHAVRLQVYEIDSDIPSFEGGYFDLIELGALIELDLTEHLAAVSDNKEMGEVDFITPTGALSANSGSLTLFNDTGRYTNDNGSSILFGLLDRFVKFNLNYIYTVSGIDYSISGFELFSDSWEEQDGETVVTLFDASKLLMDKKPARVLWRNLSVQEITWRLLDMVGFNKYIIENLPSEHPSIVTNFWTTGTQTVFEVLSELARGTQTAMYFDDNGYFRIRTRGQAFQDTASVWTFREQPSGANLPDIVDSRESTTYEPNKATVTYQATGFSDNVGNFYETQVVWEPEGTVALNACPLAQSIDEDDMELFLNPKDAASWPWKGIFQIEGEWISYDGKEYSYYDELSARQTAIVKSIDEQKAFDELNPNARSRNSYTGKMIITERGIWNTEPEAHVNSIDSTVWTLYRRNNFNVAKTPVKGLTHNASKSTVTLETNNTYTSDDYMLFTRGRGIDDGFKYLGTRIQINKAGSSKAAGIFFNGREIGQGYFLEIIPTSRMDGKMRQKQNEVTLYSLKPGGDRKQFGGAVVTTKDKTKKGSKVKSKTDVGARVAIVEDRWYDVDIIFTENDVRQNITVMINGRKVITTSILKSTGWTHPRTARFGLFARGNTKATFEHIYGVAQTPNDWESSDAFYDRVYGGWRAEQWMLNHAYDTRQARRRVKKKWVYYTQLYNQKIFDDFGPVVHEVREFDVKYNTEEKPVLSAMLYMSNNSQAALIEWTKDATGAKFVIGNTLRRNVILNGEDNLTFPGNTVNHSLFVYGRPVIQKEAVSITKQNDSSIRKRGIVDVEYQSKWTQSKGEAEALCEWLVNSWSDSDSTVELEVFGNPLVEILDIVNISHEAYDINDKYFVTAINNSFDSGLTTRITLRKNAVS